MSDRSYLRRSITGLAALVIGVNTFAQILTLKSLEQLANENPEQALVKSTQ